MGVNNNNIKKFAIVKPEDEDNCDPRVKNMDKFYNPITNQFGVKVTSEKQKLAWYELQELKNS